MTFAASSYVVLSLRSTTVFALSSVRGDDGGAAGHGGGGGGGGGGGTDRRTSSTYKISAHDSGFGKELAVVLVRLVAHHLQNELISFPR